MRLNIDFNDQQLREILTEVYGSGYAFGENQANQQLGSSLGLDWSKWKPGIQSAAALLEPNDGLQKLLNNAKVTIKGLEETEISQIGNALHNGLQQGLPAGETAKLIDKVVDNPARALTISRTESNRAMVQASLDKYKDNNIEYVKWLVADPCDDCMQYEDEVFPIDDAPVPVDDTHPNCRCSLAPVVDDGTQTADDQPAEEQPTEDVQNVGADLEDNIIHDGNVSDPFAETNFESMDKEQVQQFTADYTRSTPNNLFDLSDRQAVEEYQGAGYQGLNDYLRGDFPFDFTYENQAAQLSEIIAKAPAIAKPIMAERFIKTSVIKQIMEDASVGDTLQDSGFSSTTMLSNNEDLQMQHFYDMGLYGRFQIEIPAGSKGIVVNSLNPGTDLSSEHELLLDKGSRFEFIEINKDTNTIKLRLIN